MLNILMIDDSKAVHAFVKACLKGHDVHFIQAFDGQEGLAAYAQHKAVIDLVLLDWEMPILDGPSTLQNLMAQNPDLKVMMMTTRNEPSDIERVLGLGARDYILKPFTVDILMDRIQAVLEKMVFHVA